MYRDYEQYGVFSNRRKDKLNYLKILIYKNGEILWTRDGNHRLGIYHALNNVDKIPVKIWARHEYWQKLKDQILSHHNSSKDNNQFVNTYLTHPDIEVEL